MPRITEFSFVSLPRALFTDGIERVQSKFNLFEDDPQGSDSFVQIPLNVHTRQICPKLSETQWSQYEMDRRKCDGIFYI